MKNKYSFYAAVFIILACVVVKFFGFLYNFKVFLAFIQFMRNNIGFFANVIIYSIILAILLLIICCLEFMEYLFFSQKE